MLNKAGTLSLLHSIVGENGPYPYGGLSRDAEGNLYGTASEVGSNSYGTVWKLAK